MFDAEINLAGANWVAISPECDNELRKSVTAAVIAHQMGYKSIDHFRKTYMHGLEAHASRDEPVQDALDQHMRLYQSFYESFEPRNERIGVFAFDLAMVRSFESIKLLYLSSRQGFLIEPALIARSLIEQFAYAYKVWPTEDEDDEAVFKTKPQASISALKVINPAIGRAYGKLSENAHYHPDLHLQFITKAAASDGQESTAALQRSWVFKVQSLAWTLFVLNLQYRVFVACYSRYRNFKILEPLDGLAVSAFDTFFEGVEERVEHIRQLFTD